MPAMPPVVSGAEAGVEGVAGIYTVALDLWTLNATVTPKLTRDAQQNDDLYLLPVGKFLKAESLKIIGVGRTPTTVDLTYRVTHPFAAPSTPAGPPNATNRADLGISGFVAFVIDVPSSAGHTFFDEGAAGQVVANTSLVKNPDAYWRPRAMLTAPGIANTFPYQLLIDEHGNGSRDGLSNGGDVTGNYGP
ncbi:MAG: hypothetical protein ABI743_06500, partial [bacterium]